MKRLFFATLCLMLLCHCTTSRSIDRTGRAWNASGVWKVVPGTAHDFLPNDMAASELRRAAGHWVTDPQDGWRFFVPDAGTKSYRSDVLVGEAWKATNRHSRASQSARNALTVAALPVHVATLGFWHPRCWVNGRRGASESSEDLFADSDSTFCQSRDTESTKSHRDDKHESPRESSHDSHPSTKPEPAASTMREMREMRESSIREAKESASKEDLEKQSPFKK